MKVVCRWNEWRTRLARRNNSVRMMFTGTIVVEREKKEQQPLADERRVVVVANRHQQVAHASVTRQREVARVCAIAYGFISCSALLWSRERETKREREAACSCAQSIWLRARAQSRRARRQRERLVNCVRSLRQSTKRVEIARHSHKCRRRCRTRN